MTTYILFFTALTTTSIVSLGVAENYANSKELCPPIDDKAARVAEVTHLEHKDEEGNMTYDLVDKEPELQTRTYIATAAMFLLNLVQVVALKGPPIVVCDNHDRSSLVFN